MELTEIKIRQLTNQHLMTPANRQTVIHDLCGFQAQFMNNALHALKIRSILSDSEKLSDGLVKSWTIRGTVHIFAEDDLPLFLHQDRKHFLRPCDTMDSDENITAERKRIFADLIVRKIAEGIDEREALKAECYAAGMTEQEAGSVFNAWGGTIRALCESGIICHKVQEKKAFQLCPSFDPMPQAAAEIEIARRYFTNYAPATIKDAAYFLGATQTQVKKWLKELPVRSANCGERTYYYIEKQTSYNDNLPDCIFLAGFDPLMLGYQKKESLYLPEQHLRGIFSLSGIVMPAILFHGRVIGRWKKQNNKIRIHLFEPVSEREQHLILDEADRNWNGLTQCRIN